MTKEATRRRTEAEARQKTRAGLSDSKQLRILSFRPGVSAREVKRLAKTAKV